MTSTFTFQEIIGAVFTASIANLFNLKYISDFRTKFEPNGKGTLMYQNIDIYFGCFAGLLCAFTVIADIVVLSMKSNGYIQGYFGLLIAGFALSALELFAFLSFYSPKLIMKCGR